MLRLRFAMALDAAFALGGLHRPETVPDVDKFVEAFAGRCPHCMPKWL